MSPPEQVTIKTEEDSRQDNVDDKERERVDKDRRQARRKDRSGALNATDRPNGTKRNTSCGRKDFARTNTTELQRLASLTGYPKTIDTSKSTKDNVDNKNKRID